MGGTVGSGVGGTVGSGVGGAVGSGVGGAVGSGVGGTVGSGVGGAVGCGVGIGVGAAVGVAVGCGVTVGFGVTVGCGVCVAVGCGVGVAVIDGVGDACDVTSSVGVGKTGTPASGVLSACGSKVAVAVAVGLEVGACIPENFGFSSENMSSASIVIVNASPVPAIIRARRGLPLKSSFLAGNNVFPLSAERFSSIACLRLKSCSSLASCCALLRSIRESGSYAFVRSSDRSAALTCICKACFALFRLLVYSASAARAASASLRFTRES